MKLSPLGLVLELPHNIWCVLESHTVPAAAVVDDFPQFPIWQWFI
jgi:hypothetical protein